MNSYQLISKLREIRGDTYLTTAAQALYYRLVSICNEMKWKEVFKKRSSELRSFLNISERILIKSRIDLSDAGLLCFQLTRDKRASCYCSFATVISSVYFPGESIDDSTGETQVPPIIDIKTVNKEESLAHTHESPPPDKKKFRKEKGDKTPLVYPFTSTVFMSAWEALRKTPKWKKKLNYALQLSLDKLSMFEGEFTIQQIERIIESNWTGVVFTETGRDYQEWLKLKHENNQKSDQFSECAVKVQTAKLWCSYFQKFPNSFP